MTRRLILSYLVITLFSLVVLIIPLGRFIAEFEVSRLENGFERNATILATIYQDALADNQPFSPRPARDYAEEAGVRVVVVDANGRSIVDTAEAPNQDFSNRPEIEAALAGTRVADTRDSVTLGRPLSYVAVPVASGGDVHGAVRITFNPEDVSARINGYWLRLAAIGIVVLAAVAAVGWIIARSVTQPLRDMREAAVRAGSGDLSSRIDPHDAPAEVADLVASFNTMASRLDGLLTRQRQFVADASHELRTPLTALRLRLENLQDEITAEGADDLEAALAENDRLGLLVDQLLTIARTDDGPTVLETVDLVPAVSERTALWSGVATESGVDLVFDSDVITAQVDVVPGSIDQIIDNVISNALAATPQLGKVAVTIEAQPSQVTIRVDDSGSGMDENERERAFDRFWRGSHVTAGTGLGLAIVRQLSEAAGGTAALGTSASGGTSVRVVLPKLASTRNPGSRLPSADTDQERLRIRR